MNDSSQIYHANIGLGLRCRDVRIIEVSIMFRIYKIVVQWKPLNVGTG